ncbi:MAG: type II secretion system F family protein [Actinomycetota bacterium]|nr:type II secretion system F family protein [Actinomycetota bacterium]
MRLVVSAAYVLAVCSLGAAVSLRTDHVLLSRLGRRAARHRDVLRGIGRWSPLSGSRTLVRRVDALELSSGDAERIHGRKLLLGAGGATVGLLLLPLVGGAGVLVVATLSLAGYRYPDFELARILEERRRQHLATIPELLDVLAVSVSAGLSPRLALDRAPDVVGGLLGDQLRRARDEVALGAAWRRELRRVASTIGSPELRRLAAALERSERLGAAVGERLASLASEVRSERRARREERARRAPIQMLFPLVLLILPAFVVAAVVPAVIAATRGLT